MNSDSSELDTSSNSRGIFLPPNVPLRLSSSSATANANSTSSLQRHHGQTTASGGGSSSSKTPSSSTDGSNEFNLNELNAINSAKSPNGPTAKYVGGGASELGKPQERYVWEMRSRSPNVTPASTVLNSPDLNVDAQYSLGHLQRHHHHQIRVGRSPGSQFEQPNSILPQGLTSPGSPTDGDAQSLGQQQQQQHLRDGEIVVFDDIDTNWMNKANSVTSSKVPSSLLYHQQQHQQPPGPPHHQHHAHHHNHHHHLHHHHHQTDDILKVTKMIGQLPIAEYEGSPRRFGNQPERLNGTGGGVAAPGGGGPTVPKRPPGFPQRVSPKNPKVSPGLGQPPQQQHNRRQQQEVNNPRSYPSVEQQSYYQPAPPKQYYPAPLVTNANAGSNKSIGNLIDMGEGEGMDGGGRASSAEERGGEAMAPATTTVGMALPGQTPTFDYLYEFSETRKVLEEFFNANADDEKRFTDFTESGDDLGSCQEDDAEKPHQQPQQQHIEQSYIGQRLARIPKDELYMVHRSPKKQQPCDSTVYIEHNDIELYIDSNSRSSGDLADTELEANMRRHSRNFTLSPETTDYDSNCGDLDSLSNDINCTTDYGKLYTSMPVLEDGLSSGHASDTENNTCVVVAPPSQQPPPPPPPPSGDSEPELLGQSGMTGQQQLQQQQLQQQQLQQQLQQQQQHNQQPQYNFEGDVNGATSGIGLLPDFNLSPHEQLEHCFDQHAMLADADAEGCCLNNNNHNGNHTVNGGNIHNNNNNNRQVTSLNSCHDLYASDAEGCAAGCDAAAYSPMSPSLLVASPQRASPIASAGAELHLSTGDSSQPPPLQSSPSPPQQAAAGENVPRPGRATKLQREPADIQEAMKEIRSALQRAKIQPEKLKFCDEVLPADPESPIWVPRGKGGAVAAANGHKGTPDPEEEADTDLETDRLLGQQRLDEQAYYDDKTIWPKTSRISGSPLQSPLEQSPEHADGLLLTSPTNSGSLKPQAFSSATLRQGIGTAVTPNSPDMCQLVGGTDVTLTSPEKLQYAKSPTGSIKSLKDLANGDTKKAKARNKEGLLDPSVLIEGVLFRARYLGSTQLVCEGQPTKSTRMMQAEEAVSRIKAPEGESQPSTEVDLFISTEKIMVLNTDLKEIMMDHALRTISYIADIGDLVVLMARRRFVSSDSASSGDVDTAAEGAGNGSGGGDVDRKAGKEPKENGNGKVNRTPKMICHVFESDEAQFIAQSIGQAFQVAYMEFLKANGIEDHSFVKEMDYQEVLNSQEIFGDELEIFAKKELQKEVVVPKTKGEILGVVIVESGWGSMLPTVVIANLMSTGSAARCGQLNIGDQLIAINGMSLVGLPLSTCQTYIRNAKNQTAVKFTVVPCPPVVEVKIKRPNTKYQLGFSVQNGVICSLLRGGIAERGGVRVGHRIIEINNQSVVAVPHEKIVNLLATSVGEILMKTMPTSMFRLLTGQENPIYI